MTIKIYPKTILRYSFGIIAGLLLANLTALLWNHYNPGLVARVLSRVFDFNTEANLPTLFSTLLLVMASVLLAYTHVLKAGKTLFSHWSVLSAVFLFLAIDENISLHEGLNVVLKQIFPFDGYLFYPWVLPYCLLFGMGALIYFPFLLKLPRPTFRIFLISGALFVTGAAGLEMLEGRQDSLYGHSNPLTALWYTVEETFEMSGVALFLNGLLRYLAGELACSPLKIWIKGSEGK